MSTRMSTRMFTRPFTKAALTAALAVSVLGTALTVGVAPAGATPQDDRFLGIVKQLDIPVNSPEEAIQVGQEICKTVAENQIEPVRAVRGMLGRLMGQGLSKGQAANLIWGAVGVYCPQYSSIVGR